MSQKTEIEMDRYVQAKIARTLIRLKYSVAADREINETLPAQAEEFDAALQRGELIRPTDALIRQLLES